MGRLSAKIKRLTWYNQVKRLFHILAILFLIYNIIILIKGNNLSTNLSSRTNWIVPLGKSFTRASQSSERTSKLLVDRLQNPKINDNQETDRLSDCNLSKNLSTLKSVLKNKTDSFNRNGDNINTALRDDETSNSTNSKIDQSFFNGTHGVSRHLSSGKADDITNRSPEMTQENTSPIVDENNEFDITELDDHLIFNIEKEERRDPHIKQQSERELFKWDGKYDIKLQNTQNYRHQVYAAFKRPIQNSAAIDCYKLVDHDVQEISKAKHIMDKFARRPIDVDKYARTTDCKNFRGGRGYIEHPLSQMELEFPLAFGITVYRDVEQAERLLRSIYRPHNVYCFHLDSKMKQVERRAFERIVRCLDNVFIADKSINVTWGQFSVLEAELLCMEKLLHNKKWKYYINLTGQEFPLKTNREIVAILKSLDGANIVDGTWIRATHRYFYRWTIAGRPPPHKIRPIKGSVHVAVNRQFVDFALHDQISLDFLEWLKKTQIPDETFFASLNHNPHLGINGSFLGDPEEYPLKPSLMRYKNWEFGHSVYVRGCAGKYVRNICVLGIGDLHRAYNDIGLFVNKFNIDFEYLALDCLEEVLYNKTWNQYISEAKIDTSYYERLDYVKKKLFVPPSAG